MPPSKSATKAASKAGKSSAGFSADERAAMKERAQELKAGAEDGEKTLLSKIAAMPEPDRSMAKRIHAIIMAAAPSLAPKTWYGMPAYANREGKVVCFFQNAQKFKARYSTLGFSDQANIDEGAFFPTYFGLKDLKPADEAKIAALVKKAVS